MEDATKQLEPLAVSRDHALVALRSVVTLAREDAPRLKSLWGEAPGEFGDTLRFVEYTLRAIETNADGLVPPIVNAALRRLVERWPTIRAMHSREIMVGLGVTRMHDLGRGIE